MTDAATPEQIQALRGEAGKQYTAAQWDAVNTEAAQRPSWYHNLVADPNVTLEVGTETFAATASVADETERGRLYAAHTLRFPNYAEYQSNTTRVIPVVIFTRVP
jgi:deazaflavin-dependent oxidoreductase (nitroreductase family)